MKKYLKENKTLLILMIVAIVCIVVSSILLLKYFYFGNGGSKYGSRLEGIEAVKINDDKQNEIVTAIREKENVVDAKLSVTGKRIDIRIVFNESANIDSAKEIAKSTLDLFSEEEKAFYDFEYTIKQDKSENTQGFLVMGAKNVKGIGLSWNNNNPVTESSEN